MPKHDPYLSMALRTQSEQLAKAMKEVALKLARLDASAAPPFGTVVRKHNNFLVVGMVISPTRIALLRESGGQLIIGNWYNWTPVT